MRTLIDQPPASVPSSAKVSSLTAVGGMVPQGSDILRERLRWTTAERRWHKPPPGPGAADPDMPPTRTALCSGAQLTLYTVAFAQAAAVIADHGAAVRAQADAGGR